MGLYRTFIYQTIGLQVNIISLRVYLVLECVFFLLEYIKWHSL